MRYLPLLAQKLVRSLVGTFSVTALLAPAIDAGAQTRRTDLKHLPIEQLLEIDVTTTVTRRPEALRSIPAAISVITREEIRRSGVTTLADALTLADAVHVARVSNNTWRISMRGFNGSAPNKLLVMVDGRTINSSLFTTVFWNVLDYVLDDIERIEIIRGPGAALWGAGAVNGVVNIITRHSRDTLGSFVALSTGNEERAIAEIRHGGRAGEATTWRTYGKFANQNGQRLASGAEAWDSRDRGQVGFRVDGGTRGRTDWMVKGDAFHSRDGLIGRDGESTELALQGRWSRQLSGAGRVDLQSYYRREYRRITDQLSHRIDVFDVDGQHGIRAGTRHDILWGGALRLSRDTTDASAALQFEPASRSYPTASAFVQDEIALVPQRLFATLGAKYEHNSFSGGELQPNIRGRLMLGDAHMLWGAVSRAVRRPARFDVDSIISAGAVRLVGQEDFKAESLFATEIGFRTQPFTRVSLDLTAFWHTYDDLRSQDAVNGNPNDRIVGNTLRGRSDGVELGVTVRPLDNWRTHVGYTWLDTDVRRKAASTDVSRGINEANDPHHLFTLQSSVDLSRQVEVDATLRTIGALDNPSVPGYTELRLRLGWTMRPGVDLSVVGENLLHDQHPEMGTPSPNRIEIERAFRTGVTFSF